MNWPIISTQIALFWASCSPVRCSLLSYCFQVSIFNSIWFHFKFQSTEPRTIDFKHFPFSAIVSTLFATSVFLYEMKFIDFQQEQSLVVQLSTLLSFRFSCRPWVACESVNINKQKCVLGWRSHLFELLIPNRLFHSSLVNLIESLGSTLNYLWNKKVSLITEIELSKSTDLWRKSHVFSCEQIRYWTWVVCISKKQKNVKNLNKDGIEGIGLILNVKCNLRKWEKTRQKQQNVISFRI